MFNPVEPEGTLFIRWLVQLLGSTLFPMFVLFKTAPLVRQESVLTDYLTILVSSAGLAVIVSSLNSACIIEGKHVWIVPVMLELLVVVYEVLTGGKVTSLFYGEGEGAWAMVMLTFPVFGSCIYSLTMRVLHRRIRRVV